MHGAGRRWPAHFFDVPKLPTADLPASEAVAPAVVAAAAAPVVVVAAGCSCHTVTHNQCDNLLRTGGAVYNSSRTYFSRTQSKRSPLASIYTSLFTQMCSSKTTEATANKKEEKEAHLSEQ